ncbi:hypothetical protein D3C85_1487720 [compost metagenome]
MVHSRLKVRGTSLTTSSMPVSLTASPVRICSTFSASRPLKGAAIQLITELKMKENTTSMVMRAMGHSR